MLTLHDQKRYRTTKLDGEYVIVGKLGQVSLYADGELDVYVKNLRRANRVALTWKARSSYDDGACFIRPQKDFDLACQFIKARKRRQVTEAMRERGRELARHLRPSAKKTDKTPPLATQSPESVHLPLEALEPPRTGGLLH